MSDFYRKAVYTIDTAGGVEEFMQVPGQPSGIGWLPDGSILVISMRDQQILHKGEDGTTRVHADLSRLAGSLLNDMVVSVTGHAYVGEFGFDPWIPQAPTFANLYRVDPEGEISIEQDDLIFPNGSVISSDGRRLIVAESLAARFREFEIEPDGSLVDPRIWGELAPAPPFSDAESFLAAQTIVPDGCALDAEGHLWAADAFGGTVIRVRPGGEVVCRLPIPAGMTASSCGLGGPGRRTLLVAAGPTDTSREARSCSRDGVLLGTEVEVSGVGLP